MSTKKKSNFYRFDVSKNVICFLILICCLSVASCGGGSGGSSSDGVDGGDSTQNDGPTGINWDQMVWDQGKWS